MIKNINLFQENKKIISNLYQTLNAMQNYAFYDCLNDDFYRLDSHFEGLLEKINYKDLSDEDYNQVHKLINKKVDIEGYDEVLKQNKFREYLDI